MTTIGIAVVATGAYWPFAEDLVKSLVRFLRIPIGSGQLRIFGKEAWPHLPWPLSTMLRTFCYVRERACFKDCDYIFAMDADLRAVDVIGTEILSDLTAVLHPGFTGRHAKPGTFERRSESACYIPPEVEGPYFAGGFWGGKADRFFQVCEAMNERIAKDLERHIIPVWHDESALNAALREIPPTKVLGPEYLTPEGTDWFGVMDGAKIVALSKNHAAMRG